MLLAVEGGGFFSSSASGYTNGLALLFLGRKNEERPMRVSPWNHYHLVEQEADSDLQRVSKENRASCICSSFICFNCASVGLNGPSPPKAGVVIQSKTSTDKCKGTTSDPVDENIRKVRLKSSLKAVIAEGDEARDSFGEEQTDISCAEKRKVHWTDACGKELTEIREFEPSEECASDEELEHCGARRCACVIQ